MGEDAREIERQIEQTREHMGETVSALAYKTDVPSRVRGYAGEKKDSVTGRMSAAKAAIAGSAGDAADSAGAGARRTVGMAQENPIGLAIGAAALGFVAGSLIPSTRTEREHIGPVATEARQQVSELATEALEHGKQVAREAVDAASDAAASSGQQHAEQLQESAKQSAGEVRQGF